TGKGMPEAVSRETGDAGLCCKMDLCTNYANGGREAIKQKVVVSKFDGMRLGVLIREKIACLTLISIPCHMALTSFDRMLARGGFGTRIGSCKSHMRHGDFERIW